MNKTLICVDCGIPFTKSELSTAKKCEFCRDRDQCYCNRAIQNELEDDHEAA